MQRLALQSGEAQMIGFEERGGVGMDREHTAHFPASNMGIYPQWLNIKSQQ